MLFALLSPGSFPALCRETRLAASVGNGDSSSAVRTEILGIRCAYPRMTRWGCWGLSSNIQSVALHGPQTWREVQAARRLNASMGSPYAHFTVKRCRLRARRRSIGTWAFGLDLVMPEHREARGFSLRAFSSRSPSVKPLSPTGQEPIPLRPDDIHRSPDRAPVMTRRLPGGAEALSVRIFSSG